MKPSLKFICRKIPYTALFISFGKWAFLGSIVGILCGLASALFIFSLHWVTNTRLANPNLLLYLPLGGALVSYLYCKFGKNSIKGNNLILESIRKENAEHIPFRMTPLILLGTIITHLFGGSVGKEGTAVQMGGSISSYVGKIFKLNKNDKRLLVVCGISSGFSSVFGTPLAGTIFGMEVISMGCIKYEALTPCIIGSIVGNLVSSYLGVIPEHYYISNVLPLSVDILLKVSACSIIFAFVSIIFSELIHFSKNIFSYFFKNNIVKSLIGGIIIILLTYMVGSREYLGLGENVINQSFYGTVDSKAFFFKMIFTAITLGAGFQGGEVTPLFFVGATLGNVLSDAFNLPPSFLASLGFICLFCGAINAPITSFILAIELFGSKNIIYMFLACCLTYVFSGHYGVYTEQQIAVSKSKLLDIPEGSTIESLGKNHVNILIENCSKIKSHHNQNNEK